MSISLLFRLPFDYKTPTIFAATYAYVVLSIVPYINPILSVDALFLGCALHIESFFKDLQGQAMNLEFGRLYDRRDERRNNTFLDNVRLFVDYHNQVIDLVRRLERIYGSIFLVQYLGAMFSICTQAYLSTLVSQFKFCLTLWRGLVPWLNIIINFAEREQWSIHDQHPLHVYCNIRTLHLHSHGIAVNGGE